MRVWSAVVAGARLLCAGHCQQVAGVVANASYECAVVLWRARVTRVCLRV
jgi:hypothetical protein